MNASEIDDSMLRGLDILIWPVSILILGWLVRRNLPSIRGWVGRLLERQGVRVETPLGSVNVDPPTLPPEALLRADERVIEEVADEAPPETATELRDLADQLQQARRALDQANEARAAAEHALTRVHGQVDASQNRNATVIQHRIAAYAAALINNRSRDFDILITVGDYSWAGKRGTVALVALAFFKRQGAIGSRFRLAPYEAWVRAAEILVAEYAIPTDVPPFDRDAFSVIRTEEGASWQDRAGRRRSAS